MRKNAYVSGKGLTVNRVMLTYQPEDPCSLTSELPCLQMMNDTLGRKRNKEYFNLTQNKMTREEILKGLIEILENTPQIDAKKLKNITEKTDFISDLEVPSTELINIIAKAEGKFDVEFDDDDIDDLGSSVKGTIDLVEAALKNQ